MDDDEQTAVAFALADNRTQDLGSYDEDLLDELIESIKEQDLLLATGYTEDIEEDFSEGTSYQGGMQIPQFSDPKRNANRVR